YLSSLDKVDNVPIVYNVIVNISGLTSSGLELRLNGGVSATVPINTTQFNLGAVASGSAYEVLISGKPLGYSCSISAGGSGTMANADAAVTLNCTTCTGFFVRDDSTADSDYGAAPVAFSHPYAAGGSYSGQTSDESGHIFNFSAMCAGNYYVWVNGFDIGASLDISYGYWDFSGDTNPPTAYDLIMNNTYGWQRSSLTLLTSGDHSWRIGSMPDSNYFTLGWDQIIVTHDANYAPSGIIPDPLLVDPLDAFYGWENNSGGFLSGNPDASAPAAGEANLKMTGSSDHYQGFNKSFPASPPTYVSVWMRQDSAGTGPYLVVGGANLDNSNVVVFMYFNSDSIQVSQGTGNSPNLGTQVPGQWYHIEIKNINYTSFTMDYYVNGVLRAADVGFRTNQASTQEVHFYSLGASGSYDNLVIY
ncbi:MAG: LamG domain-containing protein, partial [Spirochaetia bacterium]|nr:LamG domain-containing protein [Spirochaetia bacterium]